MRKQLLFRISTLVLIFLCTNNYISAQKVVVLQQGKPTSLRGLSIVNDKIAWVSGARGYVAFTKDAGKTWNWQQIKGFEQSDFRDIEAFSDKEAVIMSSGTPALILKTTDAGASWLVKYRNRDTSVFLDAMDFKGKYGCAIGDPVNSHFVIFETFNKGNTWKQKEDARSPLAKTGEIGFAASGTCLHINSNGLIKDSELMIVSGGSFSSLMHAPLSGKKWMSQLLPISQGTTSAGAFSIATDNKHWVIVGGDYQHDMRSDSTMCYSNDRGKTWKSSKKSPGFQSCVEYLGSNSYLSTGTSGTNFSKDGGQTWVKIDAASFNVCAKAKSGKWTLLAGNNGKIAVLQPVVNHHLHFF